MSGRVFWGSLALTAAVLALALPLGGPPLFGQAATILLLPHLLLGDAMHWRRAARAGGPDARLVGLAALGFVVFLFLRSAGPYGKPLFYLYFFGHFWKDLTLALEEAPEDGRVKLWTGLLVCAGFAVVSSGLVLAPEVIRYGKVACWGAAAGLGLRGLGDRASSSASRGYLMLAAAVLVVCTLLDARHPARELVPHFVVIWHFMLWYLFVWPAGAAAAGRRAMVQFVLLVAAVNLLSASAALLYAFHPACAWLRFVFNFDYLAGCWTVMHVTWDWAPKSVRGVRLAVA
jgi:hypothetical protein